LERTLAVRNPQTPPDMPVRTGRNRGRVIDQMRGNPAADWRIEHVERLCRQIGLTCSPPSGGSHYKVSSHLLATILTIPARKPIKMVYIKLLVAFVDKHLSAGSKEQEAAHGAD
jgi:hypothetical protein